MPGTAARSPEEHIATLIAPFGTSDKRLFQALRKAVHKRFPTANELVYAYTGKAVIGYSPTLAGGEGIVALSLDASGVRLYLTQGAKLPDPHKLLQGKAGARYLVLESAKDLLRPEVEALMAVAAKISKVPLKASGRGELIMKPSTSVKQPKRKTAKR